MLPWLGERFGNPSSGHVFGRAAAEAIATAREAVATLIGAAPDTIYFTSGGTEADNLALRAPVSRRVLVTSAIEHPAIAEAAKVMQASHWQWHTLAVDRQGRVDLARAREVLAQPCGLLSVMLAHNETGALQPVRELASLARATNSQVVVHTDAAQAVGKIEVDVAQLGVDLLTLVGHKFYAPGGIGALYCRAELELDPLVRGGGQQAGVRSGTEPVALIVGLGAACTLALGDLAQEHTRQRALCEQLWAQLHAAIPGLVRSVGDAPTLPNTLHICFPSCEGGRLLGALPQVAASTGSACHEDGEAVTGVLGAMAVPAATARGAVRLSLGRRTTSDEIDGAACAMIAAHRELVRS